MLKSLTAREFAELLAYKRLEPFTEFRADLRAAQIAQMVFNMAVEPKYRKPLKDFMLKYEDGGEPKKKQTWQEQFNILKIMAATQNAMEKKP